MYHNMSLSTQIVPNRGQLTDVGVHPVPTLAYMEHADIRILIGT